MLPELEIVGWDDSALYPIGIEYASNWEPMPGQYVPD
jgi:hypothetical protein